jgi:hypothetical protein
MSDWKLKYADELDGNLAVLLARVMRSCHPLLDRPSLDIRTVFVPVDLVVNGRPSPGKVLLASPREHELQGVDAWLYISWGWWQPATPDQREALLDHLLAHLWYDDDHKRLCLLRPDLQEFAAVWQRRGDWNDRLERARRVLQGQLPGLDGSGEATEAYGTSLADLARDIDRLLAAAEGQK